MRILNHHEGHLISAGFATDCQLNNNIVASLFMMGMLVGLPLSIYFNTPVLIAMTGLAVTYAVSILCCSVLT